MRPDSNAITIRELGKRYKIYQQPEDRLKQMLLPRLQGLTGRSVKKYCTEFWALSGVSLDVRKGESVGIIGRNGSGKSTLLQIVCGTLNPTLGEVETQGRVAALLELGSGFNPEFTGRENVYINGAILGLSREEISNRFSEITEFADIGQFIEQPVKTYSSGMVLRLAFAVIAHVNADILIVDEALAVGDAIFNQKCMRFIRNFQSDGTLLFVSHDMAAITNLCDKAVWLSEGKIMEFGDSQSVAESYLKYSLQSEYGERHQLSSLEAGEGGEQLFLEQDSYSTNTVAPNGAIQQGNRVSKARGWKTGDAELLSVSIRNVLTGDIGIFCGGEKAQLTIEAVAHKDLANPILGFIVKDRLAQDLFGENTLSLEDSRPGRVNSGQKFRAKFEFKMPFLPNGQYVVMASVAEGDRDNHVQHHYLHDACVFTIASNRPRWGLLGIEFDRVVFEEVDDV